MKSGCKSEKAWIILPIEAVLTKRLYGKKTRAWGEIDKQRAKKARQTAKFDSLPGFEKIM